MGIVMEEVVAPFYLTYPRMREGGVMRQVLLGIASPLRRTTSRRI